MVIADKSLYDTWIGLNLDIASLENVGVSLGRILATNRILENTINSLRHMRMPSDKLIVWKTKIHSDNTAYYNVLEESSSNPQEIIEEIEAEANKMLRILNKLDAGASLDDADLLANAKWIRINTTYEPLIASDDRDLLTCGHALSSFFGINLGVVSGLEILRLSEQDDLITEYCRHNRIDGNFCPFGDAVAAEVLKENLSRVMKKAKIACHPNLRGNDTIGRILRG